MRLPEKLLRLFTPRGMRSIQNKVHRIAHPLDWREVLATINPAGLEAVAARYRVDGEKTKWPKYVDAPQWLRRDVRRAQDIRLVHPRGRQLRVLDLGSGAGYFLLVCRYLGHTGVGLDTPDVPFFGEMFELLGIPRVVTRIVNHQPLPEELLALNDGKKFDLVTAFSICFNGHNTSALWGPGEWGFFLRDIRERFLAPGGRIHLDFNPETDGFSISPELRSWFRFQGARLDRSKVTL